MAPISIASGEILVIGNAEISAANVAKSITPAKVTVRLAPFATFAVNLSRDSRVPCSA